MKYFGLVIKKETDSSGAVGLQPAMVMEFCEFTLGNVIYNQAVYTAPGAVKATDPRRQQLMAQMTDFAVQLANGLQEMRKNNLVHRDLKPENILVSRHTLVTVYIKIRYLYIYIFESFGHKRPCLALEISFKTSP